MLDLGSGGAVDRQVDVGRANLFLRHPVSCGWHCGACRASPPSSPPFPSLPSPPSPLLRDPEARVAQDARGPKRAWPPTEHFSAGPRRPEARGLQRSTLAQDPTSPEARAASHSALWCRIPRRGLPHSALAQDPRGPEARAASHRAL